jgi:hypothetical protein
VHTGVDADRFENGFALGEDFATFSLEGGKVFFEIGVFERLVDSRFNALFLSDRTKLPEPGTASNVYES